jgi:hypothetical protein
MKLQWAKYRTRGLDFRLLFDSLFKDLYGSRKTCLEKHDWPFFIGHEGETVYSVLENRYLSRSGKTAL